MSSGLQNIDVTALTLFHAVPRGRFMLSLHDALAGRTIARFETVASRLTAVGKYRIIWRTCRGTSLMVEVSEMIGIIGLTVRVAIISTLIVAPLAIGIAAISWRSRIRPVIDAVASLPLVLPPTAVGFVLLEILSHNAPVGRLLERAGIEIVFTVNAVVLACAVMSFPLMFLAARAAIDGSDMRYFDIARTLGARPPRAFATVTLPLAWRGLLAGVILAFCRAIGEFGATIIIAGNIPGRTQTLALAIYDRVNLGHDQEAFQLVICVVMIAVTAIVASEFLVRRQRRRATR